MKILRSLALAGLVICGAVSAKAELYVVQVGDGSGSLSASNFATFVKKFKDDGSPDGSISLPTAASGGNQALTLSGSATSEGFLTRSTDGQYLTLAGYASAPGAATNIAETDSMTVPRGAARITLGSETVDTSTVFTGDATFSGNPSGSGTAGNPRSAVSTNGTDIWLAGQGTPAGNAGIRYTTLGGNASLRLASSPTNIRVANIFNNQLYASSASGTFQGVSTVGSGLPTTDMQTTTLLSGFPTSGSHSSYDFWFKDASTLYVADDGSAANGGGIQKWTESGGTWSLQYTLLNTGATTTGTRGLAGTVDDGNNAVLYATTTQTSNNNLIKVVDAGAASTASILASAGTNAVFRGVEFVGSVTPPANNADFNSDGVVDGRDFLIWQRGFQLTGQTGKTNGNANADTVVDEADFVVWKSKFGGSPAVAAAGAVPEPGALALSVMGLLGSRRASRKRRG